MLEKKSDRLGRGTEDALGNEIFLLLRVRFLLLLLAHPLKSLVDLLPVICAGLKLNTNLSLEMDE